MKIPDFADKSELFDFIKNNEKTILHAKKNQIKSSFEFDLGFLDGVCKSILPDVFVETLIYKSNISRFRNEKMFDNYKNGYVLNHSISMRYVTVFTCLNSDSPQDAEYKANYDKYVQYVVNKEVLKNKPYFFAIVEAKKIEGSAVVKGSNFLTPVLSMKVIDENTIEVAAAVSPCGIIDSHNDCHIPGIWKKGINDNAYDILVESHNMDFDCIIADSVNEGLICYTKNISVRELNSKFESTKNKSLEPPQGTQNNEPDKSTQKGSKFFNPLN